MQPPNLIYTIGDLGDLAPFLDSNNNAHTLMIFDIDDTLIRMCDHQASGTWYREAHDTLTAQGKSAEEAKFILFQTHISALYRTPVELVNKKISEHINTLSKNKVTTICLTAREGRCLLYATLRHLNDAQITFTQTEECLKKTIFFPEMADYDIIYSSGILFTGGANKGDVLTLFFKKTGYLPEHIIFVDDSLANVEAVSASARKMGIAFDGFHFTGVKIPLTEPTFVIHEKPIQPER